MYSWHDWKFIFYCFSSRSHTYSDSISVVQRFPNCGAHPPGGAVGPLVGELFVWGTFILNEIWAQDKIIIYFCNNFAWLKYFYHLIPVLAPNYKQHIFSPAKFRKVSSFISWSLCHIYLFEFIQVEGSVKFMKHFNECTSYKNLGTSGVVTGRSRVTSVYSDWK
jgi:hypothetical protein